MSDTTSEFEQPESEIRADAIENACAALSEACGCTDDTCRESLTKRVLTLATLLGVAPASAVLADNERLTAEAEELADWDKADERRQTLQDERDRAVTLWHEQHKETERLRQELAETWATLDQHFLLIADLADDGDCSFDHHGGCQAHGYLSLEPGELCPHQEAKELLAERDEPPVVADRVVVETA